MPPKAGERTVLLDAESPGKQAGMLAKARALEARRTGRLMIRARQAPKSLRLFAARLDTMEEELSNAKAAAC